MALAHVLGYPRIGPHRELKLALESHWRGESSDEELRSAAWRIVDGNWRVQRDAGLDWLTAGDFSFYDHVLDAAMDLGVLKRPASMAEYFRLARGGNEMHAMEMTKWFDTNYHYLVPRVANDTVFVGEAKRLVEEARRCSIISTSVKVAMLGPLTFLHLCKPEAAHFDRMSLLEALSHAYEPIFAALKRQGVEWVQLEEPALVLEGHDRLLNDYGRLLGRLRAVSPRILLATCFESIEPSPARVLGWDIDGVHLDLVRAPAQLDAWLAALPEDRVLSAGVVDGRNVWRNDLSRSLEKLAPAEDRLGDRLWVGTSCSLLHVPVSLDGDKVEPAIRPWLAFAREKLDEVKAIALGLSDGRENIQEAMEASDTAHAVRRATARNSAATALAGAVKRPPFAERRAAQRRHMQLPAFPTTTIGSFPQTERIRRARAKRRSGELGPEGYELAMREEVRTAIERQEALGIDVLVHGEPERNDMVEFFGERLDGCATTSNGWVQSYGSRCVKPPIIHGGIRRPRPMTVDLTAYAQSLTPRPVKGMLTGPVTILKWSFPREDVPFEGLAMQLAASIRDEVADLQEAGIRVIQIDEPALREAMPLKARDVPAYLAWAVAAFQLAASSAYASTQIHTHMCYAEFGDILPAIAAMDADVVTLEASRSGMEVLDSLRLFPYPNEVGPGIYDIHSPRVPSEEEMAELLRKALSVIPADRLWVNPDCGLKTRGWKETRQALSNMVGAARKLRQCQSTNSVAGASR